MAGETVAKGKFGLAEAVVLLTISSMALIFLTHPRSLVEIAGPAAWLSVLAGMALALLQVYIVYLVLKPYPDKNIVEVTRDSLGRIAGTAANLLYALFFISVAAIFTRNFSEALLLSALPRTPISVVTVGYIAMGILGAFYGLEAMARSARVTFPFVVGGITFLLLSLIPMWDSTNLFPILGNGLYNVFVRGGLGSAGITEILLAGVIVQSFKNPKMFGKIASRAIIISYFYLTLLEVFLVLTVFWASAEEYTLPFYSLSRIIYFGRFFQRVESVFIVIWGYVGMVKIALTLYASAVTLAGTFKLPDYRPLIWPVALIAFVSSLLPPDFPTAVLIESNYLRLFTWLPAVIVPLAVLAADRIRNRGRGNEGG
ncbi:MAG: GerAB/ArcD/ProY family transporter [Desulfocucumaceae bacterium]